MTYEVVSSPDDIKKEPGPPSTGRFEVVTRLEETPAARVARGLRFFGYQPTPAAIEPIRRAAGVGLEEFAGGLLGLPGDIASLIQRLVGVRRPIEFLPTAETIKRRVFEPLARERFVPETAPERIIGDIGGLVGAFAAPLGRIPKISTVLLGSTLPAFVREGLEQIKAPEIVKTGASILTLLGTGLRGAKKPKEIMGQLFKRAERTIPEGATTSAERLLKDVSGIEEKLAKGIKQVPSKAAPTKVIDEIKAKTKEGQIAVDELLAFKRDINELRGALFAEGVPKEGIRRARALLNPLANSVDKTIEAYGRTNPEFLRDFREANKLFGEINNVSKIARFFNNKINLAGKDPITIALLAFKPRFFLEALGAKKAINFLDIAFRKPGIRKLYLQAISEAGKENIKTASKIATKLDEKIKEEKEEQGL